MRYSLMRAPTFDCAIAGATRWVAAFAMTGVLAISASNASAAETLKWEDGQQLVRVLSADWDASSGQLQRFERSGDGWTEVGEPVAVSIGRSGSAWGVGLHPAQEGEQKREGDGRSPAGLFAIGSAFGYAASAEFGIGYLPMKAAHYCIDDPTSWLYNQIVDTREVGALAVASSTEPMRRDVHLDGDQVYRLGFVVEHNPQASPNAGSCIFAHVWRGADQPTAGCTAMAEPAMKTLLGWFSKDHSPRFLLLPRSAYLEREQSWNLPSAPAPEKPDAAESASVEPASVETVSEPRATLESPTDSD